MEKITEIDFDLIADLVSRTLNCYKENGELSDEYYNNLMLKDLSKKDIQMLQLFVDKFL